MKDQSKTKQARSESEHRKVEQALKESEKSGWTILDNIQEGYYEVDLAGNYTFFNSSMSKILGYTEEEMMGMNYRLYTDKENSKKIFRDFNEVYRTGISSKVDYEQIKKDGSKLYVETSVALMRDSLGQAIGFRGIVHDITERRQMEEALRESVETSRSYLENAPDGIYMSDLEGKFLYGNRKCEEIIGYRREELIGKYFLELNILPEKSLNKAVQLLQANIEGKSTGPDEIELISKEGRIIPVEISTSVLQRKDQRIVLAFVRDITDRKRTEEALRLSEEKYRWILDNMADVITVMDMNLRFTYVSPSIIRMRGYTSEEATAQTFEQVMTPESLQISVKVFEEEMRLEASGTADPDRIRIVEVEQYRKDGSIGLMESHLSFMRDEAKKPMGIISVSRDITERKWAEEELRQAEERYRSIFENAQEGIFRRTPEGRYIMVNPAMAKMFGYKTPEELMTSVTDLTRQLYVNPEEHKKVREMIDEKGSVKDYETQFYRKDGSIFWVSFTMWAVRDEKGQILYYEGMNEDITERKKAEEELLKTLSELQEARDSLIQSDKLAAMGQLSAGVAHEILNPINIISMKIQLMDMTETLTDEAKADLQVCKDQIAKLAKITKGMSQFARVSGKQIVPCDLNQLTDHVVTLIAPRLKVENVGTAIQYQPDFPLIQMDKDKMEQVILNVINNALDAMRNKEEKTLRISTELKGENVVGLVISDNGGGIAPEILNKIFDPFFTTKKVGEGTGLGLSISYGIIQDHAGNIWAENNEWGGTSFFIELPIKHDTAKN